MKSGRNGALLALAFSLLWAGTALATPLLKTEVEVAAKVVTVGDMFDGAGAIAGLPLFLAPAPGTSGNVAIGDVRLAAIKAGLTDFDDRGAEAVRVSRLATPVDAALLQGLIGAELKTRGLLAQGVTAQVALGAPLGNLVAAAIPNPVQLQALRYYPDNGQFAARFTLAGQDQPLDVAGNVDLMVDAPQLAATLAAGTILKPSDIVMQKVSLRLVQNGNVATVEQLVGKQLQRQSRTGMVLKVSDVADPELVSRSDIVTVYLHAGPMTLTIKGTALNAASLGQPVAVMNAISKRIVHGVARADGAVEVTAGPTSVAGL
ncbi:MAG: flagellar basal body P-ring formation chaperone FlgA [Devosia sp.]|nr:flagellar basal body P-ring formation chaperone FlgA [Devosia sp.]